MTTTDIGELLRTTPLVDGHNDLPWALWHHADRDLGKLDIAHDQPRLQTDLPRLRAGRLGAQFWSVYVAAELTGAEATSAVLEQIFLVRRLCERYPADLAPATTAEEARQAFERGRIASLLGAEGGNCLGDSLATLAVLRNLGVRYLTLTHAKNVGWADSATDVPDARGLTGFGRDVVREMNRIGMIVDLSHVSTETMEAALDVTTRPVLFTHSSCRALVDNPRNVPDATLKRLAGNGGVCMITFVPPFVSQDVSDWFAEAGQAFRDSAFEPGSPEESAFWPQWRDAHPEPEATVDDVVRHVEHAREVAGIDHIGLGGDFDGAGTMPTGLDDVSCYPALLARLAERGWSATELRALMGENVLQVLAEADAGRTQRAARP
ncbi:dipeptidase [Amycolatopsis saalfeldensis]|uniref:Membrane dipeptidase n=1 Tax=Amycolatopsis saalfeldensis TaxID=394193 RepID=A0A1H8U2V0_9PSEU|nr:dipeptidase [Amycolatopsis saalfeldensis]SEO96978.1 membrane dipeptidase [Amycolatopsis saalfeldensis]